jgi:uncharacterized membrane protein YbhN (UPF0104 family)
MTQPVSRRNNLLKTLPGFAISGFFLWFTFRNFSFRELEDVRIASPAWIAGATLAIFGSAVIRIHRWHRMLRPTANARFSVCARVFLTSVAANNIMPFRIGDFMRIFTYSSDLGASSSVILSTVILEKLLDVFTLVAFFVLTMGGGYGFPSHHVKVVAVALLCIAGVGLLVMVLGARTLEVPLRGVFAKLPTGPKVAKLENWLFLAFDAIRGIGMRGMVALLGESFAAWTCEGMIFVSIAKIIGLSTDLRGPWQAFSSSNLSYLVPSSPGGLGPFEAAVKTAMMSHGMNASVAVLYGIVVHAVVLIALTLAGGIAFLWHRYHSLTRKPLLAEIEVLPEEIP